MPTPNDLFVQLNQRSSDWGNSGVTHWARTQYELGSSLHPTGQCFELTMQFVDLLLNGSSSYVRTQKAPYDAWKLFGDFQSRAGRDRLRALKSPEVGASNKQHATFVEEIEGGGTRESYYDGNKILHDHRYVDSITIIPCKIRRDPSERAKYIEDNVPFQGNSSYEQDQLEETIMRLNRCPPAGKVQFARGDASGRTDAMKQKFKDALQDETVITVRLGQPYPHQMLIASKLTDVERNCGGEIQFYDPNGGYCSFADTDAAANWFVKGLIAQTVYDQCNFSLCLYKKIG